MATQTLRFSNPKAWSALRKSFRLRLVEAVRSAGGCNAQQLAKQFGVSSPLMYYHLKLLVAAGLLTHSRGKRYSGMGGTFQANSDHIEILFNPSNKGQTHKRNQFLHEWFSDVLETSHADLSTGMTMRWERLTPTECRNIGQHMQAIQAVISGAAKRRIQRNDARTSSHVVMMGLQKVTHPTSPSPAWRCGSTRGG